ncbi:ODV-E56 (PIF-5) [Urbanus proteus nucleopolyhedrovirus]|uniref:ODV-E56 (PIF-5) n=1 Tax=Urbanus proteus nucleopolyhedrovirus TaxID=1675866 RepID=A0A162GUG4_9ABAC|nr:ODV-E56 (PIF-5) [Urbanus proteus nucleopolyhedrovirus]AKR17339.1 ODV-E56 (PIF-5) [Urbanus proteus nucleopolyhedrovirus]
MSFFLNLRRVNKVYTNPNAFVTDNLRVVQSSPSGGFRNIFNSPVTQTLPNNRYKPGYNINNTFVSTSQINSVLRNNDVTAIRRLFNVDNAQINALGQLRRMDNIPDAALHSSYLRRQNVKNNYPSTQTRTPEGVQTVLDQNPQLNNRLITLKSIGTPILLGVGIYFLWSAATLIQDIIANLNRIGGSYYVVGRNGGETIDSCLLMRRTCQKGSNIENAVHCTNDPLITDQAALNAICNNFDFATEKTVCRASDPNADVDSPQYVDISDLPSNQTIMCLEPYNLGDLIGDLGLDNIIGDNGLVTKSLNSSKNVGEKFMPLLLVLAGIFVFVIVIFFVFRMLMNKTASNNRVSNNNTTQ